MMLKLTYTRASDKHAEVSVLGSPEGIRDLHWQLTHNYSKEIDGTGIGTIKVSDLEGNSVTDEYIQEPYTFCSRLDKNLEG